MKLLNKIFRIVIIIGMIYSVVYFLFFKEKSKEELKHQKFYYAYNNLSSKDPSFSFLLTDINDKAEYLTYYEKIIAGERNQPPKFNPEGLPVNTQVIVHGYIFDSVLVKVTAYFSRRGIEKKINGFMYHRLLHEKPATDYEAPVEFPESGPVMLFVVLAQQDCKRTMRKYDLRSGKGSGKKNMERRVEGEGKKGAAGFDLQLQFIA